MAMNFALQFEDLMNNGLPNDHEYEPMDLMDATFECMDILEELTGLENNMFVLEAAKQVKKAQSGKKKIPIIKSKMKAKKAKAKKSGGKVLKIVKEGDTEGDNADGGTGPLPTTSDTRGLTDDQLDADPDAEVEVTEIDDSGSTTEDAIFGTEGVDYIVEYEDAMIATFEAEQEKTGKNIIQKFWEWLKSVGRFIASAFKTILAKLMPAKKLIEAVSKKADAVKSTDYGDAKIKAFPILKGKWDAAEAWKKLDELNNLEDATPEKQIISSLTGNEDGEMVEMKLNDLKNYALDNAKYAVDVVPKFVKNTQGVWKKIEAEAKKALSKSDDNYVEEKKKATSQYKKINKFLGTVTKVAHNAISVLRAIAPKVGVKVAASGGEETGGGDSGSTSSTDVTTT